MMASDNTHGELNLNTVGKLIVYNDDDISYHHVILSFIDVLNHTITQAEQCATIINNSGHYCVKLGSYSDLKPLCSALNKAGINAEIQILNEQT